MILEPEIDTLNNSKACSPRELQKNGLSSDLFWQWNMYIWDTGMYTTNVSRGFAWRGVPKHAYMRTNKSSKGKWILCLQGPVAKI